MSNEIVCIGNVIFELYRAALNGEITTSTFFTVKNIVERARIIPRQEIIDTMAFSIECPKSRRVYYEMLRLDFLDWKKNPHALEPTTKNLSKRRERLIKTYWAFRNMEAKERRSE